MVLKATNLMASVDGTDTSETANARKRMERNKKGNNSGKMEKQVNLIGGMAKKSSGNWNSEKRMRRPCHGNVDHHC
jgi:hypothetical protein